MSESREFEAARPVLELSALATVNYALQLNGARVIQSVTVHNPGDTPLENVQLRLSAQPELILPLTRQVDYIPARETFAIRDLDVVMNADYLAGLTEKTTGVLEAELLADGAAVCTARSELTALAFDEWHGYGSHPQLLASFVQPNHPRLAGLSVRAAELLGGWTGDPSLDGYQSQDANRVRLQAAAVYGALQEQNVVYAVPPASFEQSGQRVRLGEAVLDQKLGTCLDLGLLYASVLEALGLHALLILQKTHMFVGVWLEDLTFAEAVQDDASLVTKRLAEGVGEIAVVECTALTAGKTVSFDEACILAQRNLTGTDPVECIIDVNRARLSGVQPLPTRVMTENGWRVEWPQRPQEELTAQPKEMAEALHVQTQPETPASRKNRWERKLLELGLRNNLINLRLSKNMIPLLTTSIDQLEDALADGSDFSVLARPSDWQLSGGQTFEAIPELGKYGPMLESEFKNHRLRSSFGESELEKAIKELYRSAKTALEENGANTLYLALGLLRWYENPRSTRARYAPVVLLPVEMVRRSAAQGYTIRLRDEEPQVNVTMLEKLKQDFQLSIGGLDPLPMDEHGVDLRRVFTILRKAVMGQKNWDVLESAWLGIFSFSQFVMWNDIRNRSEALGQNKLVRSLMDGKLAWDAKEMSMGDRVPEDGVLLPLSADASQLFAIRSACEGESFVLHGPPGTGKSQTITALIANALAQGKSVLFVAEKMAALEVVQKRLDKIGIGPFCLELHSNRSRKRDVLEQLRQATEVTRDKPASAYAARAEQVAALRGELDAYAAALHKPQRCGKTLFELIQLYEARKDAADLPPFPAETVQAMTAADLDNGRLLVQRLTAAAGAVGHPAGHPLSPVGCTEYSQQLRSALPTAVAAYETALDNMAPCAKAFGEAFDQPVATEYDLQRAAELARGLEVWLGLPRTWAKQADLDGYLAQLEQLARLEQQARSQEDQLWKNWSPDFVAQDGKALLAEYRSNNGKWALGRALGVNALVRKVAPYARGGVDKTTLEAQLELLTEYQATLTAAEPLRKACGDGLEGFDVFARPEELLQQAAAAKSSAQTLWNRCGSDQLRLERAADPALAGTIRDYLAAWAGMEQAFGQLNALLALRPAGEVEDYLADQKALCRTILDNRDSLKEWMAWNAAAEQAQEAGLTPVLEGYQQGMEHGTMYSAWEKAAYRALAEQAIDADPALAQFSGAVFNQQVAQLKQLDAELMTLAQEEIYCRLAANVPDFAKEAAQSSELGILQRAIRSGGRGVSIRRLFEQIPNLLPRLCPCMLMSPISAAQYLEPDRALFDIVVFDEASQLPTCKAVGALARGKNAVVVGDPKQMPPTSFFMTNTVDEDNLDEEDLESILDDCLALNMPQTHLLWHYRSRHESLIAFSNHQFYENRLYTFPSVNDRERKVRLVHVDGVFDRGRTRQNRAEADAVVAELKRRSSTPAEAGLSVGVVTFNIMQQNLIDDLLTEACREDEALERWLYSGEEPVFIKNLENVQGDERDVILFSVGYGPDAGGHVSMNFGPLNRDGGWRRLNVAVSRARCEMIVFAALKAEQIDLGRTTAEGVAALKAFLEYADGRELALDENTVQVRPDPAGAADALCAFLAAQGYQTQRLVGRSAYRIDIGVVDPADPERYILGILLDGSTYAQAKTTRDREFAQIGVLEGLGWKTLRVWSMDWWDNCGKEQERVLAALRALEQQAAQPEAQPLPAPEPEPVPVPSAQPETAAPERSALAAAPEPPAAPAGTYTAARLAVEEASAEELLTPAGMERLRWKLNIVLKKEAPVSEALLVRRVVQSFGMTRSSRVQAVVADLLKEMGLPVTREGEQTFYWPAGMAPVAYQGFRANGAEPDRREPKDVPVQEAANALCCALFQQISLPDEDLLKQTGKKLGFTRFTAGVRTMAEGARDFALGRQLAAPDEKGTWTLTPSGMDWAKEMEA